MNPIEDSSTRTLESYSRAVEAPAVQWLGTLTYFSGLVDLQLEIDCPQRNVGFMSHISTTLGSISCIRNDCPARLRGLSGSNISLVVYVHDLRSATAGSQSAGPAAKRVYLVGPHQTLYIGSSNSMDVLLIQFEGSFLPLDSPVSALRSVQANDIISELNLYLNQVSFAPDHDTCLADTDRCLIRSARHCPSEGPGATPGGDRPKDTGSSCGKGCSLHSGHATRLALQHKGTHRPGVVQRATSVQPDEARPRDDTLSVFVRSRLVRVRNALIRSSSDSPGVSWHALSHGFNHLGRFPSLYKELFGELPSETLAWRRAVMDCCDRLRDYIREL